MANKLRVHALLFLLMLLVFFRDAKAGKHARAHTHAHAPAPTPAMAPTPKPSSHPVNNPKYGITEGSLQPQECGERCTERCSATQYHKPCMFFCQKCCAKCLCVPAGKYGNKQSCPCYNNWKTKRGGPKCP